MNAVAASVVPLFPVITDDPISGWAGTNHSKWAAKEAKRAALSLVVTQPQPKIIKEPCAGCSGKGSYLIAGIKYACRACNSRGYILAEEINCFDVVTK